jgi:hypothetical protein
MLLFLIANTCLRGTSCALVVEVQSSALVLVESTDTTEDDATSPTAVEGKTCDERYIRADHIEQIVWNNVKEILEHPEVIIAELKRQSNELRKSSTTESDLLKEIGKLRRKIRNYERQER